jgi:hypothetical protein
MPAPLYFPLKVALFLVREEISIPLEHGFRFMACHFHAFLDRRSRLPHLMCGGPSELVKNSPDIIWPGAFPPASQALPGSVEHRDLLPGINLRRQVKSQLCRAAMGIQKVRILTAKGAIL